MAKCPKGEKRPADVVSNAVHVMRIAIGEAEERKLNPDAVKRGALGGMSLMAHGALTKSCGLRRLITSTDARLRQIRCRSADSPGAI